MMFSKFARSLTRPSSLLLAPKSLSGSMRMAPLCNSQSLLVNRSVLNSHSSSVRLFSTAEQTY